MIVRAASLAQARAAVADGAVPGAGLTLAMARGADASPPIRVLDISRLPELHGIREEGGRLRIGALVTVQQLSESRLVQGVVPTLSQIAGEIGSAPLRRLATVGGNVAWGAGDLVPVLLAHRAEILRDGMECPIDARPLRGLIEAVFVPAMPVAITVAEKVGVRAAFSPTLVTVAATARLVDGVLHDVVFAVGGGAERPRRLPLGEAALQGMARVELGGRVRDALEREILGDRTDDDARLRARIAANVLADGLRGTTP